MKNKRNIFSEWINKIRNRNRVNEGIYYVSQRLRRTAKVVIPELNGLQDSINGVNDRLQTLDNNTAKKNTANTFTQKQTFRNEVEFGTNIKAGYGAGVVNLTPEDDSNKTLSIQRFDINMNNKKISNLANPTNNNDAVNKGYVDNKSTELTNEINSIKQKNTEQDSEITNIKNKNNTQESDILEVNKRVDTQTNEINAIKQKNTEQDSRITALEESKTSGITIVYKDIVIEFPVGTRWNIGDGKSINGDVIPGKPIFMNTFYYGAWLPNNVRYGLSGGMGWLFGFFNYPRNNGLTFYYSCINPYQTKGWDSIPLFESERSITFRIYFIPNPGIREIDLEPTILNFNEIETVVIGEEQ